MPLKCSKPKPGPPVVSISTVRAKPSALGLPGHGAGAGGATTGAEAGTCAMIGGEAGCDAAPGLEAGVAAATWVAGVDVRSRTGLSGAVRAAAAGAGGGGGASGFGFLAPAAA